MFSEVVRCVRSVSDDVVVLDDSLSGDIIAKESTKKYRVV